MKSKILSVILKQLRSSPDFTLTGIKKYRDLLNSSAKIFKTDKKVDFKKFHIDSIPAAWITPGNVTEKRVILYLHGGGFVAGSITSHRDLATRIAKASKAKVLIIDYRLAPEHK
ncbi:MAG: alpha/beta hydrolase fold domain-containing protein, partial [Thermodesulfobacteriota bacterium]|nr:alpha/beta hydrolase fold domain-containing protein [Thermodesulfobacteriota bacterium]